ncbi:hypothetical protein BDV98DRAFT_572232 [Pterulicium gracile]|uniref:Uncharacterized protein n=1 Tax=Pterulicium gracile TaxID=1884261 RepID=A0A5C3QF71_9AGAR|nr:hypothetical protein BDV98DRAFT_572232 [Pterula gracilis]
MMMIRSRDSRAGVAYSNPRRVTYDEWGWDVCMSMWMVWIWHRDRAMNAGMPERASLVSPMEIR